jgi:nicotinamidase-related amidase
VNVLEDAFPNLVKPGALFVPGADADMIRLADFIDRTRRKLYDIHITLDSHHTVDVAHPIFLLDSSGKHPDPFTIVSASDITKGSFRTTNPDWMPRFKKYVNKLEENGRYPLCIWPPHCLIGSFGYGVYPRVFEALVAWEEERFAVVDKVTKGSNYFTEHYSAVQADVPDDNDPDTQLNQKLIQTLEDADIIILAGEARSHCLANTVRDIADNFGKDSIEKMHLLEDCTSDVPGFEDLGESFIKEMTERGMKIVNSITFLK